MKSLLTQMLLFAASANVGYSIFSIHICKLEIWGKAQRKSAWHPKSDWGNNLKGSHSSRSEVMWPELQRISIRRKRRVDLR